MLPLILDSLPKKLTAFLKPTRATTPIRNEIYMYTTLLTGWHSYIANGKHSSVEEEHDPDHVDNEPEDNEPNPDS